MDNYGFKKIPFSDVLKLARDEIGECRLAVRIGEDNWRPFNFASILDDGAVKVSWWVSFYPLDGSMPYFFTEERYNESYEGVYKIPGVEYSW